VAAVVFLYQITVFFYNKTQQHHFWNFILMTQMRTVYVCGGGSQQREVADGADVQTLASSPVLACSLLSLYVLLYIYIVIHE